MSYYGIIHTEAQCDWCDMQELRATKREREKWRENIKWSGTDVTFG